MSNNYTSEHDSTYNSDVLDLIARTLILIDQIVFAFTLAAFIYGATSWFVLVKFRNYRNYVFLNLTLANFFIYAIIIIRMYNVNINIRKIWLLFSRLDLPDFFNIARHYWLLVISYMFYVDFVNVFKGNSQRRYLKSNLIAWGVPFLFKISRVMCSYLLPIGYNYFAYFYLVTWYLPMILNCILYVIIVYSLLRSFKSSANTAAGTWRRLYVSTLIFVLCDVTMMPSYIASMVAPRFIKLIRVGFTIVELFTTLVLDVFLVVVKSNRQLWYELYVFNLNQRSVSDRNHAIIKPEKYISKPDHQQV